MRQVGKPPLATAAALLQGVGEPVHAADQDAKLILARRRDAGLVIAPAEARGQVDHRLYRTHQPATQPPGTDDCQRQTGQGDSKQQPLLATTEVLLDGFTEALTVGQANPANQLLVDQHGFQFQILWRYRRAEQQRLPRIKQHQVVWQACVAAAFGFPDKGAQGDAVETAVIGVIVRKFGSQQLQSLMQPLPKVLLKRVLESELDRTRHDQQYQCTGTEKGQQELVSQAHEAGIPGCSAVAQDEWYVLCIVLCIAAPEQSNYPGVEGGITRHP